MNVAPITADGWTFEIIDSKLSITSGQNGGSQVRISAKAAFALLNYLYQERNELHDAAQQDTSDQVESTKSEARDQEVQSEITAE